MNSHSYFFFMFSILKNSQPNHGNAIHLYVSSNSFFPLPLHLPQPHAAQPHAALLQKSEISKISISTSTNAKSKKQKAKSKIHTRRHSERKQTNDKSNGKCKQTCLPILTPTMPVPASLFSCPALALGSLY